MKYPTGSEVLRAIEDDEMTGFCLACGEDAYGVEPDAEKYRCEACGKRMVYGAEQCLIAGYFIEEKED